MSLTLLNNRYQIIRSLGHGGFGETFLAEDTQMPSNRKCVIKQLKPTLEIPEVYQMVQDRFQREAAILEQLGEENNQIPRLYAYFAEDEKFYLVQEWVEGATLKQKVENSGVMNESAVKEILINILPVLDYVHSQKIVHRDIKPDNIILRDRDCKPVLIDFGAVRETMGAMITMNGSHAVSSIVIGTPGFMSAEQSSGRAVYVSDLYSLGLTAIYLLTGKAPLELANDPSTAEILWQPHAPNVSSEFAAILDKAIQYHPRERYPNAKEMLAAVQSTVASPTILKPESVDLFEQEESSDKLEKLSLELLAQFKSLPNRQKIAIAGGTTAAFLLIGLWMNRPSTPVRTLPSSKVSISVPPSPTITPVIESPLPDLTSPGASPDSNALPHISESEALDLIQKWLDARKKVFGPPFERQLAAEFLTDKAYNEYIDSSRSLTNSESLVDWLQKNKAYYVYSFQKVQTVKKFKFSPQEVTLEAAIEQESKLYKLNSDNSIKNITNFPKTIQSIPFTLKLDNGKWKIADYPEQKKQ